MPRRFVVSWRDKGHGPSVYDVQLTNTMQGKLPTCIYMLCVSDKRLGRHGQGRGSSTSPSFHVSRTD
jgi:hypothetical protein